MTYSLNIEIPTESMNALKAFGYNLCIAQPVNDKFNVVCSGDTNYRETNIFQFENKYQVFGTGAFVPGGVVTTNTNPVSILQGQHVTLTRSAMFGPVTGDPKPGQPIFINNEYGTMSFGVGVARPSPREYSNIFVSRVPFVSGAVYLTPKRTIMVWFDQNLGTDKMFDYPMSNVITVDFPDGVDIQTIRYVAPSDDPGSGTWVLGQSPLLGRTYEPETNTFKLEDKYFPKPELIKLWNDGVDEGDAVGSTA